MREIKFRAWDVKDKKMLFDDEVTLITGNHLLARPDTRQGSGHWLEVGKHYEFMQYTGLKDKNGVDIYEGDWCRAEFRDRNGITVIQGNIVFDEYMWCINATDGEIYSINRPHNFEVIGNIHENPELL